MTYDEDDPEPYVPERPRPEFTYRVHAGTNKCAAGHLYSCRTGVEEYVRPTPCPHCADAQWASDNRTKIEAKKAWVLREPTRQAKAMQRRSAERYQREAQF